MPKLVWITPKADQVIAYCARVSNPANQENPDIDRLINYCVKNSHWSIFEMASACIEIETTRDIARQILRHRSFSFQEFSQRYADTIALPVAEMREARLQDKKNRQNSIQTTDKLLNEWWQSAQTHVVNITDQYYQRALNLGIAKEQARALLPEGLTTSRMYMSGSIRSWLHYIKVRNTPETQKEHRLIAESIANLLEEHIPITMKAFQ